MKQRFKDKIKLFRIIHNVNKVYISISGELFLKLPENFTGQYLDWYENGQLWYEGNYKDGKLHGKCLGWYENSEKEYEFNYKNGGRHGKCISWDKNGNIIGSINWLEL